MNHPLHLKERLSEIEPSAYEFYGLRFNPFPMSGVAPEHPKVFAAREEAYKRISDFIVRTYRSKKWSGLVVIAEYGNGKTHTLKLIRDRINQDIGTTPTGKCFAVYIENLGDSLTDFYSGLLREIGFSLFLKLLWNVVSERFKSKLDETRFLDELRPRQLTLTRTVKNLKPFFSSLSTFKEAVSRRYLSRTRVLTRIRRFLREVISNENLLKCCSILVTDRNEELIDMSWRYISGRLLTSSEYRKLGLNKKSITDEEVSQEVFGNILGVLRENSFTNVYLLIDEIEDVIPIPKQRKRVMLGGLRRIIDNNQQNLMMSIATTMAGWMDFQRSSPPLGDRFPTVVELFPLNLGETKGLISKYLSSARTAEKVEGVFPFTEQLITKIWKKSEGNLRKILELSYEILEKGALKKVKPLDSSLLTG